MTKPLRGESKAEVLVSHKVNTIIYKTKHKETTKFNIQNSKVTSQNKSVDHTFKLKKLQDDTEYVILVGNEERTRPLKIGQICICIGQTSKKCSILFIPVKRVSET